MPGFLQGQFEETDINLTRTVIHPPLYPLDTVVIVLTYVRALGNEHQYQGYQTREGQAPPLHLLYACRAPTVGRSPLPVYFTLYNASIWYRSFSLNTVPRLKA
jgi:hypothetical protein